jgi:peptide chain release factor 3
VCRLRDIPIITFINKVDREGRDPFDLLDDIESTLALDVRPMTWPVGMGGEFEGLFDLHRNRLLTSKVKDQPIDTRIDCSGPADPVLAGPISEWRLGAFRDAAELAQSAYPAFDLAAYHEGHLTPVYFGSALKDYGVAELLAAIGDWAPAPRVQPALPNAVTPDQAETTGFVFKVQANMDPNHRDRVAFFRVCSGRLKRGMKLRQSGTGKSITVHNPMFFFARERELTEEALPGDIVGIPNHGTLRVGDTLTESEDLRFTGIPNFAPEILRRVRLGDPMRAKQMRRALEDLAEEGVTQVFRPTLGSQWIVGVVGQLQLDVLVARMADEYKIKVEFEASPFQTARWVTAADPATLKRFIDAHSGEMAEDRDGAPVFLARDAWELNYAGREWPDVKFLETRERD